MKERKNGIFCIITKFEDEDCRNQNLDITTSLNLLRSLVNMIFQTLVTFKCKLILYIILLYAINMSYRIGNDVLS